MWVTSRLPAAITASREAVVVGGYSILPVVRSFDGLVAAAVAEF
jgi:hypothetical protein